jgi:ATP-dependent DNA helicase RecG
MIELCQELGLPGQDFEQRSGFFVLTMWRDWLTDEVLASLGINERQVRAVAQVKKDGRIANSEYQELAGVTRKTAARDLEDLVEKGVLKRVGEKRGSHYTLAGKK